MAKLAADAIQKQWIEDSEASWLEVWPEMRAEFEGTPLLSVVDSLKGSFEQVYKTGFIDGSMKALERSLRKLKGAEAADNLHADEVLYVRSPRLPKDDKAGFDK